MTIQQRFTAWELRDDLSMRHPSDPQIDDHRLNIHMVPVPGQPSCAVPQALSFECFSDTPVVCRREWKWKGDAVYQDVDVSCASVNDMVKNGGMSQQDTVVTIYITGMPMRRLRFTSYMTRAFLSKRSRSSAESTTSKNMWWGITTPVKVCSIGQARCLLMQCQGIAPGRGKAQWWQEGVRLSGPDCWASGFRKEVCCSMKRRSRPISFCWLPTGRRITTGDVSLAQKFHEGTNRRL